MLTIKEIAMPNISNVRLRVTNGDDGKSTARVTYRLFFKQGRWTDGRAIANA